MHSLLTESTPPLDIERQLRGWAVLAGKRKDLSSGPQHSYNMPGKAMPICKTREVETRPTTLPEPASSGLSEKPHLK